MIRIVLLFFLFSGVPCFAQDGQPLEYLEEINEAYEPVLKRQLDFATALAQGQPADLVEKYRSSLLNEIRDARENIRRMPPHRGNTALRDSVVLFMDIFYDVVREDYAGLVDMEQLSKQSYDQMEAYLRAQEAAYARMGNAARAMKKAEEEFAKKFGVRLVNSDDRFSQRLRDLNETFSYYNRIYVVFFNAYQQELNTFRAVESQDPATMEEERRKLEAVSTDGLAALDRIGAFRGERSLRNTAAENLRFYLAESSADIPVLVEYYAALSDLKKSRELLKSARDEERRKQLTDEYNALVRKINASAETLDALSEKLNRERAENLDRWNNASEEFLKRHIE